MLPKWVKVSEGIFNKILNTVTIAKDEELKRLRQWNIRWA